MEERRRHERIDIHMPAYFVCMDDNGSEILRDTVIIRNISQNGVLLESPYDPPGTNFIRIKTSAKDKRSVEVTGKVVYSIAGSDGRFMIGIAFKDIPHRISEFTKSLVKASDAA